MLSRGKGILLPVFSLPSCEGVGTLGAGARFFVDFLKETGQNYWQILPLNPLGKGNSPYASPSAFAGNELFIDLEDLVRQGLLKKEQLPRRSGGERVDYNRVKKEKMPLLIKAARAFKPKGEFFSFCEENEFWLPAYAAFCEKREKMPFETTKILQFFFFSQWQALREYANESSVMIIGDLPFYVGADSVDIISNPHNFRVGEDLTPTLISGVPPDEFSSLGQLWETPVYNFEKQRAEGFKFWRQRINQAAALYDCVRLDHFRAFSSFYAVPKGEKTAQKGQWIKGVGMPFFEKLEDEFSRVQVIAEDLGCSDSHLRELLKKTGFPSMKVLQFAFDGHSDNPFLPKNFPKNCVCYTGTHDNDTAAGWYENADETTKKEFLKECEGQGLTPCEKMIALAMKSRADTVIIPLQDYLERGSEARINTPATEGDKNWSWRVKTGDFTEDLKRKIKTLSQR